MIKKGIPLTKPFFDEEELNNIKNVLNSGLVAGFGKYCDLFANRIKDYAKVKYAVCVNNCTAALHLALLALDIGKNDEVIVSDLTFPATGHVVLEVNAKPIFVDVDKKTYNILPDEIKERITERTKAAIPVHNFGQCCDMQRIMKIAKDNNLKVIEDAAPALGALFENKMAGSFGDVGCYSFHGRKTITTGEGGAIVSNNKELIEKAKSMALFGSIKQGHIYSYTTIGFNYKLSEINAAIGLAQMDKLDKVIEKRRKLACYYNEKLENLDFIETPFEDKRGKHTYQSYVCMLNKKINRDKVIEKLQKEHIQTQIGTYSSCIQPVYKAEHNCQNSIDIFKSSLALPMFYELEFEDIDFIVNKLKNIVSGLS